VSGDGKPVEKQYPRSYEKVITEKTIPYLAKDLKSLDIKGADGKPLSSFVRLDPSVKGGVDLAGIRLKMQCRYKDTDSGTWEEWGPPYGGATKEYKSASKDKLAQLHAQFNARFAEEMADTDQF
jgi:hypothetical protein